ncbi:transporter substrate-binding domain-containing protein [Pseudodesulfovibrio cashew]|uniref:Transporter substrate-binding domain-containing protein n=1 Tax=Pseudodesulfovibrio cashew TaxID=2678688 RepID=A0A6I6JKI4_9BACT|nr:transporter substrate-binding domain-containing protein [Pseudodesulfovibrio cashew]QGY41689.1 transporter substrate-binding domain-containing protein [Pseudodesulfovibrio cashew]
MYCKEILALISAGVIFLRSNTSAPDCCMPYPAVAFVLVFSLLFPFSVEAFDVPEQYRKGVTISLGRGMPPMASVGLNGEPKGYMVDLWRKWAMVTGVPVTFVLDDWNESLKRVQQRTADLHGCIFATTERERVFDFSQAIYSMSLVLVVPKGSPILSMEDMKGKTLAVLSRGASQTEVARRFPEVRLKGYPTAQELIDSFVDGETDGMVTEQHNIFHNLGTNAKLDDFVLRETVYTQSVRGAVKKGDEELLDLVNRGLSQINDEERERILSSWYVMDPSISHSLKIGLGVSFGLLALALAYLLFGGRRRREES